MPVHSPACLVEALTRLPLLEPSHQAELPRLQALFPNADALARELVRLSWLTPYQVERIFQGRGEELVLGSYVLLESLGEVPIEVVLATANGFVAAAQNPFEVFRGDKDGERLDG